MPSGSLGPKAGKKQPTSGGKNGGTTRPTGKPNPPQPR